VTNYFFSDAEIKKVLDHKLGIKIVAFCGKSGVGKDFGADFVVSYMRNYTYIRCYKESFATTLKKAASSLIPSMARLDFYSQAKKNLPGTELFGKTPKEFLQFLGTDLVRKHLHPDFWVASMAQSLKELTGHSYATVVISDLRFQNEYDWVISQGGIIIHVTRDVEEVGIKGHISDATDNLDFHCKERTFHVDNNDIPYKYKEAVLEIASNYLKN